MPFLRCGGRGERVCGGGTANRGTRLSRHQSGRNRRGPRKADRGTASAAGGGGTTANSTGEQTQAGTWTELP